LDGLDVQTFSNAVSGIDFGSGEFRIEITDSENVLLECEELEAEIGRNARPKRTAATYRWRRRRMARPER
jgi:hypothetical protein